MLSVERSLCKHQYSTNSEISLHVCVYFLGDFVCVCTYYAVTSCMCVLFTQVVSFCVVILAKVCWLFGNIHAKLCCSQTQCEVFRMY